MRKEKDDSVKGRLFLFPQNNAQHYRIFFNRRLILSKTYHSKRAAYVSDR